MPVVRVQGIEERPGGAANVALNVASLGGRATVVGITGDDEPGAALSRLLERAGAEGDFVRHTRAPTITKLRVVSRNQQLIRLDFEDSLRRSDSDELWERFTRHLAETQVVILSDYGKGALDSVQKFISSARAHDLPVLVDPKGVDFSSYRSATLITPNRAEFEGVVGPCADDATLVERGMRLIENLELEALLITRGEEGMTLLRRGTLPVHLPTRAREVFDVTGAGDTVISVLGAGLAAGLDVLGATALANLAAGVVVGKLGTAAVSVTELRRNLFEQEEQGRGIVDEEQLLQQVEVARAHGEKIVMTNGCFDILHAGHVTYLEQARRLGDRLIVAVNDDASVRRLKGENRPVNSVGHRMQVLAGLAAVDWVVPFAEDTPERLVCRVLPDSLVKGGDYDPNRVAGNHCVWKAGGEVVVLGFMEGVSTTGTIARIRDRAGGGVVAE